MLRIVRKNLSKYPIITLLLAFLVTFESCTKEHTVANITNKYTRALDYSSDDFYRGIILGEGPIVALVPSLVETNEMKEFFMADPATKEQNTIITNLLVERAGSQFKDWFKKQMISGDQQVIAAALDSALTLTYNNLISLYGLSESDGKVVNSNILEMAADQAVALEDIYTKVKDRKIDQVQAMEKVRSMYPNADQTVLKGISAKPNAPGGGGTCVALAVVFVIALAVVGFISLGLHLHTLLTTRYAVLYAVHFWTAQKNYNNNFDGLLVNDIATSLK